MHSLELLTLLAGVLAGFLGALLGIGGGVLMVPLLNGVLGLTFAEARSASLIGVLGTSSSAAMIPPGRRIVNPRLAIFLLFFSVSGAFAGARYFTGFSERTYEVIFGLTMASVAIIMLGKRNSRNILPAETRDLGIFGSRIYDEDSAGEVTYRVKRLPLASAVACVAGILASVIGIGGGIVIVPALNSLCGVPMRVAAATGVLMIGVTAIPGSVAAWASGGLGDYHVAGLACVGAVIGFQLGLKASPYAAVKSLKTGMSVLLGLVAIQYLFLR